MDKIYTVCREYNAFLIVDDAHGIGVLGKTGRGIIEDYNLLDKVDMITGTFSKSFGSVGGYAIARKEIITLLRYYSRQNIFSAAATPQAAASAIKAIQLVDKEPKLRNSILENIEYFKNGLEIIGLDYGNTVSAIFPVMVRNEQNVKEASRVLFDQGVYVNPISYPAVPEKLSRLRFSITAMHTQKDLDETLDILDSIKNIYKLCK